MDQKWFLASASSRVESSWRRVGESVWFSSKNFLFLSSFRMMMVSDAGQSRIKVDGLRRRSPPKIFTVPSATGNIKLSPFIGVNTSFALSLLVWISNASISSNSSMSATIMSPFQMLLRMQCITEEYTWQDVWAELMQSRLVFRRNRVIIDHCSERYYWSVEGHSEPPFVRCFPIRKFILNISQIAVTFHGICPPFFVQASLQQHRRCPFFHSAHCSFGIPMCFWSVWRWRTMIPGKCLSRLAKFQGIVRMNDFRFPCRLQKLHWPFWSLLGLAVRFCTGRTDTTGLLSQEPPRHTRDCSAIHFTKNFLICSNQISEMFRSGHDCTSTSSARNPRYFRLQADVAIWVLREVNVDTQCLPEPGSTFARGSIGGSWGELEVSRYPGSGFRCGSEKQR